MGSLIMVYIPHLLFILRIINAGVVLKLRKQSFGGSVATGHVARKWQWPGRACLASHKACVLSSTSCLLLFPLMGEWASALAAQEGTGFASASGFAPQKPFPQRHACLHLTLKNSLPRVSGSVPAQHGAFGPGGQVNDPAGKKEEAGGRRGVVGKWGGRRKEKVVCQEIVSCD